MRLARSTVLLPQPDGPMMAVISCRWILRWMSFGEITVIDVQAFVSMA
jgi:hypothetical protein